MKTIVIDDIQPKAVATEADLAAWEALSRDEQIKRMKAFFADPACSRVSSNSMDDILKRARAALALDNG